MIHNSRFTIHDLLFVRYRALCIFTLCIVFAACRTHKKIVSTPLPLKLKGENVIELFDSVEAHKFDFKWLVAKIEVEYKDRDNDPQSFDVNLRARKDSAIWLSITPLLGIEVARVLITRDSLLIIDRIHKTCMVRGYGYLEGLLKTKVNFEIMQAVMVGNYFPYLKNEKLKSVYEDSTFLILSTLNKRQAKRVMEDKDVNKPIIQDFWIDGNYKIRKSKITDDKLNRTLEADYNNFFDLNADSATVNKKLFPQNIEVNVTSATPLKIKVQYNKVTEEPTSLPFNVPEKYERR
jgi:hypothetical protein